METQNKQTQVANYIEKLTPAQLVADTKVSGKFIQLYDAIHGNKMGEAIYNKEQFNFMKVINESPALQECTKLSLYGCFLDVAVMGLSLDQSSKPLAYMTSRNAKTKGTNGVEVWEKRASIQVSPYGELVMRMRAGHIKHADNPIVVYEGDTIKVGLNEQGRRVVKEYDALIPRKANAKIIGGFIRIERHGGAFENPWIDISEMDRLKGYSNKQNKGTATESRANALYTSNNGQIDPGFFEAKIIKHAFRSYPKVRTGEFTTLQTQVEEEPVIDYGMSATDPGTTSESDFTQAEEVKEEAFGADVHTASQSVTIETNDDTF